MLDSFVLDGTVTLIAIAVLVLELAVVLARTLSGCRRPVFDLVANAFSGLFLILALRAALVDSGAATIATFLTLAFIAHVAGLARRLNELSRLPDETCIGTRSSRLTGRSST
ncbi:MAG: hypothetical protein NTV73_08100 [Hyphomicrobiales bacterium]|nr:hypothetical protein [Hyphomicrobiales bacterium]